MAEQYTPKDLQDNLDYLNETKDLIKQALIDKEQPVSDTDTFRSYADKIRAIESGMDTSDATATPEDLISPKTAYVNGEKITGSLIPTYDSLETGNVDINNIPVDILNYVITDIKLEDSICIGLSGEKEVIISKVLNNRVINDNKLVISLTQLGITSTTALIRDVKFSEKLNTGDYVIWVAAKEPSPHRANVKVYVSCLKYNPTTHTIYSDYLQTTNFQSGNYCTGHPECEHITIFPFEFNGIQKCMWFLNTREQLYGQGITSCNTFTLSSPDLTLSRVAGATFNLEATNHNGCYREGAIMIQKIGNTVLLLVPYNQLVSYNDPYMWSAVTLLNNSGNITSSHLLAPQKNRNMFLVSEQVAYINGAYYNISNIDVPLAQSTITLSGNEMGIYYDGFIYVFRPTISTVSIYSFSLNTYKETFVRSQSIDWFNTDTTLKKLGILPYVTSDGLMYASTLSRVGPYTGRNNAVLYDYYTLTLSLANAGKGQKYLYSLGTEMGTLYNPINSNVISSDILSGKLAYNTGGLVVGTMPDNGPINIIPGEEEQIIPKGYTSGGTVNAVDITNLSDYKICDAIADNILEGTSPCIPLEYIQSSGTQWIDTKVGANATSLKYEAKFSLPTGATDGFLWSQWNADVYGLGDLYNDKTVNKMCYFYKNTYVTINSPGFTYDTDYVISSDMNLSKITTVLNGTTTTQTRAASAVPYSIKLFRRGNDTSRYWGMYKLYYLKIYVDGTLSRDFIPAKDFNEQVCLYDKVSKTFFYNQGTTDFIAGPIVDDTNLISPLDFTAAGNSTLTNSETTLIYKRGSNQYLNGAEANLKLKVARKYRLSFNAESESQENIVIIYGTTEDVEYSYATGKEVKWSTSGYQQIEFITKQEDIQIYFSTHGSTFKQVTITDLTLYLID